MKRLLFGSVVVLAMSLLTVAPAAAAETAAGETAASETAAASSEATVALAQADRDVDAGEARVTCNYRVWWSPGINIHSEKDRESRIIGFIPVNTVLTSRSCTNSTGGNYGTCGTGNLWKVMSYGGSPAGYVATKCLERW